MALQDPVVVAGFFRSGTSLLYALLNGHPRIALMYECNAWELPGAFSWARSRHNWLERQEFYNKALSRHRLTYGGSLRGLEEVRRPEDLYRVYAQARNAEVSGEKSPLYGPRLESIARSNPQTAFILVWREPTEIYRSVLSAGRAARFFRRNMLSRLILSYEEMIRQSAALSARGAKIHHLTYHDLVARPAEVCRGICDFLEIEFDERMLDLPRTDLSALDAAPHHDHLRRGVIERRPVSETAVDPYVVAKLERYRTRWERLRGIAFAEERPSRPAEPGLLERAYHRTMGRCFFSLDLIKRILFEILPLAWLRSYRQTKHWFLARRDYPVAADSLGEQFRRHWVTLLVCIGLLTIASNLDRLTGPGITLAPFYAVPVAAMALLINRSWGTVAAMVCAMVWSWGKTPELAWSPAAFLWNTTMRFLLLQLIVLLTDRVRVEAAFDDPDRT